MEFLKTSYPSIHSSYDNSGNISLSKMNSETLHSFLGDFSYSITSSTNQFRKKRKKMPSYSNLRIAIRSISPYHKPIKVEKVPSSKSNQSCQAAPHPITESQVSVPNNAEGENCKSCLIDLFKVVPKVFQDSGSSSNDMPSTKQKLMADIPKEDFGLQIKSYKNQIPDRKRITGFQSQVKERLGKLKKNIYRDTSKKNECPKNADANLLPDLNQTFSSVGLENGGATKSRNQVIMKNHSFITSFHKKPKSSVQVQTPINHHEDIKHSLAESCQIRQINPIKNNKLFNTYQIKQLLQKKQSKNVLNKSKKIGTGEDFVNQLQSNQMNNKYSKMPIIVSKLNNNNSSNLGIVSKTEQRLCPNSIKNKIRKKLNQTQVNAKNIHLKKISDDQKGKQDFFSESFNFFPLSLFSTSQNFCQEKQSRKKSSGEFENLEKQFKRNSQNPKRKLFERSKTVMESCDEVLTPSKYRISPVHVNLSDPTLELREEDGAFTLSVLSLMKQNYMGDKEPPKLHLGTSYLEKMEKSIPKDVKDEYEERNKNNKKYFKDRNQIKANYSSQVKRNQKSIKDKIKYISSTPQKIRRDSSEGWKFEPWDEDVTENCILTEFCS